MKWTKTFLPRRHNAPSPACSFCWAGSFAFDGALQDVRIAAKKSNRFCGVRIERGKRDEGAPDAALSGPLRVFAALNLRDPGGSSCSAMRVKNEDEALAMEREVSAP